MDIGSITIVLILGLLFLIAIGKPLGLASAVVALVVMILKFEPTLLTFPFEYVGSLFTAAEAPDKWVGGILTGRPGTGPLYLLAQKVFDLLTEYVLISVPLFIFMAALLERSGLAKDMYDSLNYWLSGVRGGIAIVTSLMAVVLAAMSGIIGGEVVLLGLIALPQMLRLGYDKNLAIGTICASGSLGTMIPPSIVLIMFGVVTETSIKSLFTGAFIPGAMLATFIIVYIVARTQIQKHLAPLPDPVPGEPQGGEKGWMFLSSVAVVSAVGTVLASIVLLLITGVRYMRFNGVDQDKVEIFGLMSSVPMLAIVCAISVAFVALTVVLRDRQFVEKGWGHTKGLVPPFMVVFIVMGSIYGGVTGITEAAGMGAFAVLVIAIFRGEFSFELLWDGLMRTLRSTGTIIWITVGAAMLAGAYTLAGGPAYIADLIVGSEMPTMMILLAMMLIPLFMGAFMDWVGIVLLIIPVFLPIVRKLPIEEIGFVGQLEPKHIAVWFGVLFCMNMQVSFLSPPFGPAAFYLKSVAPPSISLGDIFRAFIPFIGVQICALSVLLIWPSVVTILL